MDPGADSFPSFSLSFEPLEVRGFGEGAGEGLLLDEAAVTRTGAGDAVFAAAPLAVKLLPLAELTNEDCWTVAGEEEDVTEPSRFLETAAKLSDFFNPEEDEVFRLEEAVDDAKAGVAEAFEFAAGAAVWVAVGAWTEFVEEPYVCWGNARMVKGEGAAEAPF